MPIYYKTISDSSVINAVTTQNMMVHLGEFTLRDGNRYLDVKTDITSSSLMMFFHSWGYLYNRSSNIGWAAAYAYTTNSLLNINYYNTGTTTIMRLYRVSTSPYNVCLKFDSLDNGYSEGKINIFFASHNVNTRPTVVAYAENDSSSNYY